jgi:ethanolamine utilization cobalamin adenosyltransferase
MAERFITESWLRQHYGLGSGTEVHLHTGDRLTPSAQQLLAERQIVVRRADEQGRSYLGDQDQPQVRVHPLTSSNIRPDNQCSVCGSDVEHKPALLTHLDNHTLVLKNHPRIALRGRLDSITAHCIVLQHQLPALADFPAAVGYLADLRSYMGTVLRCEVTGDELAEISMGAMDAETLHQISHNPLKYLQHDHIVPAFEHGEDVALLNQLRAEVREVELLATEVYLDADLRLARPDIVAGLNRLSSAIYVLMLLILVARQGHAELLEIEQP